MTRKPAPKAKAKPKHSLDGFRSWLEEMNLSDGTIDVYVGNVTLAKTAGGFVNRLRDDDLAPKTRRIVLAAARRYADYTRDRALTEQLRRIKLPPPRRKTARTPITREQLFAVVDEIAKADYLSTPIRGVLGMMACRGFRVGDVLRLQRSELAAARELSTLAYEAKGRRRLEFKVIKNYRRFLVMLAECTGKGSWSRVDELVAPEAAAESRRKSAAKAIGRALVEVGIKAGVTGLYPHRLRRTYAVEYLRAMKGDPEAIIKLTQHMQWAGMTTALEYVDHARGAELDIYAERIFDREPPG